LSETHKDRYYSIPFPRLTYVKDLLFRVHREHELPTDQLDQERASLVSFLQSFSSASAIVQSNTAYRKNVDPSKLQTYRDVLFMQNNLPLVVPPGKKNKK